MVHFEKLVAFHPTRYTSQLLLVHTKMPSPWPPVLSLVPPVPLPLALAPPFSLPPASVEAWMSVVATTWNSSSYSMYHSGRKRGWHPLCLTGSLPVPALLYMCIKSDPSRLAPSVTPILSVPIVCATPHLAPLLSWENPWPDPLKHLHPSALYGPKPSPSFLALSPAPLHSCDLSGRECQSVPITFSRPYYALFLHLLGFQGYSLTWHSCLQCSCSFIPFIEHQQCARHLMSQSRH